MKKYYLPPGRVNDYPHPAPERTAYRNAASGPMDFDLVFQVWPNRESMARSIRMQERGDAGRFAWKPMVKLSGGEGY